MNDHGRLPVEQESRFSEGLEDSEDDLNFIDNFTFTEDVIFTSNGDAFPSEELLVGTEINIADKEISYDDEDSTCEAPNVSKTEAKQKGNRKGKGTPQKRTSSEIQNVSQGKKPRGRPPGRKDMGKRIVVKRTDVDKLNKELDMKIKEIDRLKEENCLLKDENWKLQLEKRKECSIELLTSQIEKIREEMVCRSDIALIKQQLNQICDILQLNEQGFTANCPTVPNQDSTAQQTIIGNQLLFYSGRDILNQTMMENQTPTMNQSSGLKSDLSLYQIMDSQDSPYKMLNSSIMMNETTIDNQVTSPVQPESFNECVALELAAVKTQGNQLLLPKPNIPLNQITKGNNNILVNQLLAGGAASRQTTIDHSELLATGNQAAVGSTSASHRAVPIRNFLPNRTTKGSFDTTTNQHVRRSRGIAFSQTAIAGSDTTTNQSVTLNKGATLDQSTVANFKKGSPLGQATFGNHSNSADQLRRSSGNIITGLTKTSSELPDESVSEENTQDDNFFDRFFQE